MLIKNVVTVILSAVSYLVLYNVVKKILLKTLITENYEDNVPSVAFPFKNVFD